MSFSVIRDSSVTAGIRHAAMMASVVAAKSIPDVIPENDARPVESTFRLLSNEFTANGGSTSFTFQIGTGTTSGTDDVTFSISTASASSLGISSNNISTSSAALTSITAVGTAIDTINSTRSDVGAAQNRLDFATSNLAASIENAEAARSQLLDLDIASEITQFTSKQVLLQAGVAMLAQANQLPQNLLQLLQ